MNFAPYSSIPIHPPSVSNFVGAWMLRKNIDTYGLTWQSVARYHSATPALNQRYQARLYAALQREIEKTQTAQPAQPAQPASAIAGTKRETK